MRLTCLLVEEHIFVPVQNLDTDLASWEKLNRRDLDAWKQTKATGRKVWAGTRRLGNSILDSFKDWLWDFNERMMDGGEKVAFQQTPWSNDDVFKMAGLVVRTYCFRFGY